MAQGIKGLLLDIDGTLVDSNDQHARAWCDAFRECGLRASVPMVRKLIGMGGDKLVPRVTGFAEHSSIGKRVSTLRRDIFRKRYLHTVRPFRRSRELILRLAGHHVRLAIASSSELREREALLEIADIADLLRPKDKTSQASQSKPDPDVVHAALAKLRLSKRRIMMVGDTPYDVEAAAIAGIRTVALRCGGWSDNDLAGAIEIHDGPWALLTAIERGTSVIAPAG